MKLLLKLTAMNKVERFIEMDSIIFVPFPFGNWTLYHEKVMDVARTASGTE